MAKHIKVIISFKVGMCNKVEGSFELGGSTMENDFNRLKQFMSYAFREGHHDLACDIQTFIDHHTAVNAGAKRLYHRAYDNSFEDRTYDSQEQSYSDTMMKIKNYGTEGDAKKEMKKYALNLAKEMYKQIKSENE